jgi:undecaprenyl diphosphate synthase
VRLIAGAQEGLDPRQVRPRVLGADLGGEPLLSRALDTRDLPDPDFIIRTSGEQRISNFLLWQSVYAEFEFPAVTWPDFTPQTLAQAVGGFRGRERRFGRVATLDATAVPRVARAF